MKQGPVAGGALRRARRSFALAFAASAALLALPAAASAATQLVDPTGTDSADCTVTPCEHIQQAVDVAAANDTIQIAAGTYDDEPNNQVVVTKGLIITGAGIGATILDGNGASGLVQPGTLSVQTNTSDPVSVSGLTIREPGNVLPANPRYAVFTKSLVDVATAPAYSFDGIRVEGGGPGQSDYNFYASGSTADLEIANSQFTGADFNPILLERQQGPADIHDNTITKSAGTAASSAYFDMNYTPSLAGITNGFAEPHLFRDNIVDAGGNSAVSFSAKPTFVGGTIGGYERIQVSGNTITNLGAASLGVSISNDTTDADGSDAEIQDANVFGNSISAPGATGLRFRGLVSDVDVNQNQIVGAFTRSIQFAAAGAGHAPAASEVHRNRLVGATGQGLEQLAGGAVDAENNWWGCNEGPNADPGCTSVVGASVDFDPWLVLGVSAAPTSVEVGGNDSTITADLNFNSDGGNAGAAHLDGFPVAWSTDLGTIAPPSSPLNSGVATSTLTSGAIAGTANPAATVDNETTSAPVEFTDTGIPETQITSGPTSGVAISQTSASWSFTSPNDPAATFECRIDSADDAAFAPCTSPHNVAGLSNGPHVFEVRAVDVNDNADGSPARATFVVDTSPGGVAGATGGKGAGACSNRIAGTKGPNKLTGTGKGDRILGMGGNDVLRGKKGYDCLKGHKGNDRLFGGLAGDILQGGPGNDFVNSRDGKRDKINCGPGNDTALVDQRDVVKNCETIRVKRRLKVGQTGTGRVYEGSETDL